MTFFTKTKKERADTREEELEIIKDTLNSQKKLPKKQKAGGNRANKGDNGKNGKGKRNRIAFKR